MDVQDPEVNEVTDALKTQPDQSIKAATITAVFLLLGLLLGAWGYSIFAVNQRTMIEELVGTQIAGQESRIANQVIEDVFSNIQGGQPQAQAQPQEPGSGARAEVSVDDDPVIGSPNAPVTIIEFSDFRCPYCGRFASETFESLIEGYGEYIYFVYRDFAILGPESVNAAVASECADDQEQFWAYHDLLFANQSELSRLEYIDFAEELNLDVEIFTTCIDDETYLEEVQADATSAQQLGITGTPTFFINGRYVSGAQPLEVFARIIEEELEAAGIEVEQ